MRKLLTQESLDGTLNAIVAQVGKENGIAPLDYDALVPVRHLPFPLIVISGTMSSTAYGLHGLNDWFTDSPAEVQLWRLRVPSNKKYTGFAVTEDGVNFYRKWEGMPAFGIPSSDDLYASEGKCLFLVGNSLCRWIGNDFFTVFDFASLLERRPELPPDDDCLYGIKNGQYVKICDASQILLATARTSTQTSMLMNDSSGNIEEPRIMSWGGQDVEIKEEMEVAIPNVDDTEQKNVGI